MSAGPSSIVLVAHRRGPVARLIRTNLDAEGYDVAVSATPTGALAVLRTGAACALVLDADLVRGDTPDQALLRSWIISHHIPALVISCEPDDRRLARSIGDAPFLSRPDDVDQICAIVNRLILAATPV